MSLKRVTPTEKVHVASYKHEETKGKPGEGPMNPDSERKDPDQPISTPLGKEKTFEGGVAFNEDVGANERELEALIYKDDATGRGSKEGDPGSQDRFHETTPLNGDKDGFAHHEGQGAASK